MVSDNHIIEIDEPDTDDKDLIKITLDKRNVELPIAYDHTIATRYNNTYTQRDYPILHISLSSNGGKMVDYSQQSSLSTDVFDQKLQGRFDCDSGEH